MREADIREIASRLSGLSYNGVINRTDLAALLRDLDGSTFTEASISRLMQAASDEGNIVFASGGKDVVRHEEFLRWISKEESGTIQGSAKPHSNSIGTFDFDVVVIGAGPVGCHAATRLKCHGHSVAIVDSRVELLGIPTGLYSKGLRQAAEERSQMQHSLALLESQIAGADRVALMSSFGSEFAKKVQHKVVSTQSANSITSLKQLGIKMLFGYEAAFADAHTLKLRNFQGDENKIRARCFVVATGSTASRMPGCELDGTMCFDADSIKHITGIPDSIVINGGGIVACEYATIYAALGSLVTLVVRSHILREQDESIATWMRDWMEKQGIEVIEGEEIVSLSAPPGEANAQLELMLKKSGKKLIAASFLWAGGRTAATQSLQLANAGIACDSRGVILVNDPLRAPITSVPHIAAVGDVVGLGVVSEGLESAANASRLLTDVLKTLNSNSNEGVNPSLSGSLSNIVHSIDCRTPTLAIPSVIWTVPGVACVGLTQQKACDKHGKENVSTAFGQFSNTIRASVTQTTDASIGFLKLVYKKCDLLILGVHIVGPDSAEMIQYAAELVNCQRTLNCLIRQSIAAVTYTEVFKIAAMDGLLKESQTSDS